MRIEKIAQQKWVLPFCKDSTGKKLELVCFYNDCPHEAVIKIENTILQYGIPAFGYWYCVLAEDAFVIAFDTIYSADRCWQEIMFTGQDYTWGYKMQDGEWFYRIGRQRCEFSSGFLRMSPDGHSWIAGYPGPELVYLRDEVGILADGSLYARHANDAPAGLRFILGSKDGEFGITSDRRVYKAGVQRYRNPAMKLPAPAVDIRIASYGYLVMGAQGELFFSANGQKWKRETELVVTAIAAGTNYAVAAKPDGMIEVFKYDNGTDSLTWHAEIQTNADHISELVVIGNKIGWQSASSTFDFLEPTENGMYRSIRDWLLNGYGYVGSCS